MNSLFAFVMLALEAQNVFEFRLVRMASVAGGRRRGSPDVGNPMNIALVAFAEISRALGIPLRFPG